MTQTNAKIDALTELQGKRQWVVYCIEPEKDNPDRLTKVPYNAQNGYPASTTNPKHWSTYEQAVNAHRNAKNVDGKPFNGIGYVFNDDETGIDLDQCRNLQGNTDTWAQAIIDEIASYSELSPSETGVHIIARGVLPEVWNKKKNKFTRPGTKRPVPNQRHEKAAIEMYCEDRFFTWTGNHLAGTPTAIVARQDQILALHTRITAPKPKEQKHTSTNTPTALSLSDNELIDKAHNAKNGARFAALWRGNTSEYQSDDSRADAALCQLLAFWTGKDASRMDSLFRRSSLYREKWDRATSGSTYGWITIERAIEVCTDVYTPTASNHSSNGYHPSETTPTGESSLPQIYLSGQLRERWDVALNALRKAEQKSPTIFVQSARLVQIGQDDKKHPIIMQLGIAELKNALSRSADYYRLKEKGDDSIPVPISPPKEIAESILALNPSEWQFPSLEAIIETPVIRPDGSILDTPGYDQATRLY